MSDTMRKNGPDMDRREFLRTAPAAVAGIAAAACPAAASAKGAKNAGAGAPAPAADGLRTVHTTCLGCNARCGMRAYVDRDGRLDHVTGNPYHPYNMAGRPIPYATPAKDSLGTPAPICGKAHEAGNYAYGPYRILKPLKRAGERGSGRFEPIEWDQLIQEVSDGGPLFSGIGDTRAYPGIASVLSDDPIDPEAPELGSKRNGLVLIGGRDQAGYQDFSNRFVRNAVGSINRISHTDICGLGFRMGNYALTEGKDVELKADPMSCEYMLVFGANVYEALQPGITWYGSLMAERHAEGKLKFVVIDPRATNASAHADRWLAVAPGGDGPLALGMMRVMIEEKLCNSAFLGAANPEAAKAAGFAGHCNATHLVIADGPDAGRFLRRSDLQPDTAGKDEGKDFMILPEAGGDPLPFTAAGAARLDAEATISLPNGESRAVATAFHLMRGEIFAHTLEEYAELSGIPAGDIAEVAREFASHGTKAAVCQYHGAGNYVGGTHASYAVAMLNVLVGSVNREGGYMHGGGSAGAWNRGIYDLTAFEGQKKPGGVRISREGATYEKSSEFRRKKEAGGSGYPARRPWFSFTRGGLCVEAMNGIDQKYPYGCQVLLTFFFNPVYSIPGGTRFVETLKDHDKVPLHISIDICVNESNLHADYIVPNLTYLEGQYSVMSPHAPALKFSTVRVPAIEPLTGRTKDGRPFCMETFMIDVAERLKLPGFGEKAIPGPDGSAHPLHRAEDYYLRGLANLARNAKVAEASADDVAFVERNYPLAQFRSILTDAEWRGVCAVAARGGVFDRSYESLFDKGCHKHGIPRFVLWNEKLAQARNSVTGARFVGTPSLSAATDASGASIAEQDRDYPFTAVTYKMNVHGQSRTTSHKWAMEIFPENMAVIHTDDAAALGLKEGDMVRIVSRSCPDGIRLKARPTSLIRRGCVAVSFHYGHTQMGAGELEIRDVEHVLQGGTAAGSNGRLRPDPRLGAGASFNLLGRLDATLGNTPLVDPCGGIPDFSSTRVRIERA